MLIDYKKPQVRFRQSCELNGGINVPCNNPQFRHVVPCLAWIQSIQCWPRLRNLVFRTEFEAISEVPTPTLKQYLDLGK